MFAKSYRVQRRMQVILINLFFSRIHCLLLSLFLCSSLLAAKEMPVLKNSDLGVALTNMSSLKGFSSNFKQVLGYHEGGERVYTGTLAVLRPGKFNWHYLKPYEQIYVSNGEGVLLYEPDLMQVQRLQDLGEVDPVVLQLLDGRIGLSDILLLDIADETLGYSVCHVRIGQKQSNQQQAVEVWLGIQGKTLRWIESRDVLGNTNRLYMLDVDKTMPDKKIFEFIVPEGVDVIGFETSGADKSGAL